MGAHGLIAGALHDLEASIFGQFRQFMLQSGQQLTSDWLLTDREHSHRKITERCGGVQLIALRTTSESAEPR